MNDEIVSRSGADDFQIRPADHVNVKRYGAANVRILVLKDDVGNLLRFYQRKNFSGDHRKMRDRTRVNQNRLFSINNQIRIALQFRLFVMESDPIYSVVDFNWFVEFS